MQAGLILFGILTLQVVVLALVGFLLIFRRDMLYRKSKNRESTKITQHYNVEARELKEERKQKIISFVREKGAIANDDVERLLNVADTTATNYLQELEEEGHIEQVGISGRGVFYRPR